MHLVRTKNSYHPYVQVAYYLNCLPEDILSSIPRTTRFDWQHREIHNAFGYDWFKQNEEQFQTLKLVAQNKRLLSFNKGLLKVVAIKRFLETNASAIRAGRLNVKRVVFEAIQKTAFLIGVKPALRYLNLSFQYYSRLKSKLKCATSSFNLCRIKHPSQLLMSEVSVIKKYCQDPRYQFWPISSLYHQMTKDRAAHMDLSTLYKYVALLNLRRNPVPSRRKNHTVGIRAEAPFKILHADLTEFKTEDRQKSYIYLIQDNYSRAILGHIVSQTRKAIHTMQNLIQVKEEYLVPGKIDDCVLMTDDGSENYGEALTWVSESESPRIKHLVAPVFRTFIRFSKNPSFC